MKDEFALLRGLRKQYGITLSQVYLSNPHAVAIRQEAARRELSISLLVDEAVRKYLDERGIGVPADSISDIVIEMANRSKTRTRKREIITSCQAPHPQRPDEPCLTVLIDYQKVCSKCGAANPDYKSE